MALTTTEVFGFCDGVRQFMQTNESALQAAGLTLGTWITDLTSQKDDAVEKNDEQEAAKAALRTKTQETNTALQAAYDSASTKLDAIIGTLGKTSELGKQAARIRSDIRRGGSSPTPPPPTP